MHQINLPLVFELPANYSMHAAKSHGFLLLAISTTHQIPNHGEHVLFLEPKWLGDLFKDFSCLTDASWAAVAA
jgi:hypothetical protein